MIDLVFYKEEFDTTIEKIEEAEAIWGAKFPEDYKKFLLKYNGCRVFPDYPKVKLDREHTTWPIERFLSVEDLVLQKKCYMYYTWTQDLDPLDWDEYNLDPNRLITIAIAERGIFYINLKQDNYGQIYYSCPQDVGLVKVHVNNFNEFLNSIDFLIEEDRDEPFDYHEYFERYFKIHSSTPYHSRDNTDLTFDRFKETLSYLIENPPKNGSILDVIFLLRQEDFRVYEFLAEKEFSFNEFLAYSNSKEFLQYIIHKKGLDINKPYKGIYPLIKYTDISELESGEFLHRYHLIENLLSLEIELDFSVDGQNGNLIKSNIELMESRLEELQKGYDKYIKIADEETKRSMPNWEVNPHMPGKYISELLGRTESVQPAEKKNEDSSEQKVETRSEQRKIKWYKKLFKKS